MRKQRPDFKKKPSNLNYFYDIEYDKDLIEASLAAQYGIRLRHEPDISYAEFSRLMAGLMQETPLGHIVNIRMEKDPQILKKFGAYEKKLRGEWALFKSKNISSNIEDEKTAQEILKTLFQNH